MSTKKVNSTVTIYNARLMFRNFSGEETQYNPKGNRNFCIFLEPEIAKQMEEDGWSIRYLKPKEPEDLPQPILPVKVAFGNYPPTIIIISNGRKTKLNEDNVGLLDWAEIEQCDVIVRPYNWTVRGQTGVKAYLKSLYAVLAVDELAKKYDYHEGAEEAIGGCGNCEVCDGGCGSTAAL